MEAGLAFRGLKPPGRKRALILDAKPHRYDQVLSDISGQDIEVHKNKPNEAIRCVRNWLSGYSSLPLPGAEAMQGDYRLFQAEIPVTLKRLRLSPRLAQPLTTTFCLPCATGSRNAR